MITRNIARLMTDGRGRRAQLIAEALGITSEQAFLGLEILRKHSRVRTRDGVFHLTEKGQIYAAYDRGADYVKRSASQQERRTREAKTKTEINRDYRAKVKTDQGLPPPVARIPAKTITQTAIASRPALQAVWQSMASEVEA